MSIKIIVDNNFFDSYDQHPNIEIKKQIIRAFKIKSFAFYPCLELLEEMFGIYNTTRKDKLQRYAGVFLEIMGCRVFNQGNRIILWELEIIQNEGIFLDTKKVNNLKSHLKTLANGKKLNNIDDILNQVKTEKEKWYKHYKATKKALLESLKKKNLHLPHNITFDEFFQQDFAVNIRKDCVKQMFQRANKPISGENIDKIVDNKNRYPYHYTMSRILTAYFYYRNIRGGKVIDSDIYDQFYLLYLTELDYLVSDDVRLKDLAEIVFGNPQKVINFEEFIKLIPIKG